jgi:tetratricopeptide (TPR) repeat protein
LRSGDVLKLRILSLNWIKKIFGLLKVHTYIIKLLFLAASLIAVFSACSPESTGFFGKGWHNTTARYNAYFLARQKLEVVEQQINDGYERNFNQLLHIYPPLDTVMAKQYEESLKEAMKMASLAIERHKNSKWVDDSYLLVGKARFYGREFEAAVETFKYVNTKGTDDATRHKALIFLMRTFLDDQQLANAKGVADFLRKEKLNKENERDYHLAMAMLYRQREEWETMAAHMEEAVAATSKKEGRATYHFILGQLYQQLEQEENAYKHFEQVLKSNPDYELSFFSRLHMAQVANLAQGGDEKKIRRYFAKLIKDRKNKEYRDKIYYELGNFEFRRGNMPEALANYKKSIEVSENNPRQKSYAFRKLAEIYYTDGQYRRAKAYYDSTASTTPQDEKDYAFLQERQKIMTELVTQLNVIERQDSLLRLATMDQVALEAYLDEVVREEEQARTQAASRNRQNLNQVNVRSGFNTTPDKFGTAEEGGSSVWYFYNTSLVSTGQSEFIRRWGNRPLEDNWRRSKRSRDNNSNVTQSQSRENFDSAIERGGEGVEADNVGMNTEERLAARRAELLGSVPMAPEQQQQAQQEVETAYYNLGRIFNFELKEFNPTVSAYTSLLDRFQQSEYRPEVLYNLYLLYLPTDSVKANGYKNQLIAEHPESTFAKTVRNPNYEREEDQINNQLKQLYARAYSFYQREAYTRADSILQAGLRQYPNNAFTNRLELLHILILGQTQDMNTYQEALKGFLEKNEDPELEQYTNELLQASFKYAENDANPQGPLFEENFDQPHYFVVAFRPTKDNSIELLRLLDSYNAQEEKGRKLKATTIILTEKKSMIFVSQFPDKTTAMQYFRSLERNNLFSGNFENAGLEYFVISKDNFSILYNSKDVGKYTAFFQKFYY